MGDVHLLLDWHMGLLGCTTTEATPSAVPLSMDWKITCPQCLQCVKRTTAGPQKIKKAQMSQPPHGEAFSMAGLAPLMGGRKQPMNALELAYYTVLRNDATVLRTWFEPCPLALPGKVLYWPDFRCVMWDGSIRWIEVKARKKTGTERIVARFEDDAKIKWKQAIERYTQEGETFYLAIGWRERGVYRWDVQETR